MQLPSITISGISIEGASFNNRDGLVMKTGKTGMTVLTDIVCCPVRVSCKIPTLHGFDDENFRCYYYTGTICSQL